MPNAPPRAIPPSDVATRAPGSGSVPRYVAELHEIKQCYAEFEIIGPPEVRDVNPAARYFAPHQSETTLGQPGADARDRVGEAGQANIRRRRGATTASR